MQAGLRSEDRAVPVAGERRKGWRALWQICAALIAAWCLFAAFWRLDGVTLFRDEADTALLAQEMVQHHHWTPSYFDGHQLLTHLPDGSDIDKRFIPVIPGWLQFYVEAAGFLILGVSTWTARFPFALLGLAAFYVIYRTGRVLFAGPWSWLPLLFASTSVFTWYAIRQARYYALVYLFASLLLYEFCRYLKDRGIARRAGFYWRVGIWGVLLDFSHWGSFAATWFALSVFVFGSRDRVLRRGWAILTAALAIPAGAEFALIHLSFLGRSRASLPFNAQTLRFILRTNGEALWMIVPFCCLAPAVVWLWWKHPTRVSAPLVLTGGVIVLSVAFTTVAARAGVEPRYYLQILPALALFEAITVVLLARSGKGTAALVVGALCLLWPDLSWNANWSDEMVARQLARNQTYSEPLYDYLGQHTRAGDTLEVYPNEEGQPLHFYVPRVEWVGQLDSTNAGNRRFAGILPASAFDDYPGVDWLVIWHNPIEERPVPKTLTPDYRKVWEHRYGHPASLWDRLLWRRLDRWYHGGATDRLDGFEVWRRGR